LNVKTLIHTIALRHLGQAKHVHDLVAGRNRLGGVPRDDVEIGTHVPETAQRLGRRHVPFVRHEVGAVLVPDVVIHQDPPLHIQ
jgi:hypothetical protein